MLKLLRRNQKLGFGTVLATAAVIQTNPDDNWFSTVVRPITFWKSIFPIYLQYKFQQFYYDNDETTWEKLHNQYAPAVLQTILDLKGIYIKMGQLMSQRPDMAPEVYREAFKILLDGVNGLTGEAARKMVETNLGMPIESVFSYFNDVPIGAASIAQVHYARLLDGTEVVVKCQHPQAYELFKIDIQTVNRFVRLAQPEQALILDEFEEQFLLEFDFEREAWALNIINENLEKEFPNVIVPKPFPGLVRKNIMVMEYVPGIKLVDAVVNQVNDVAKFLGMSMAELQHKSYHPDPWFKLQMFAYACGQYLKFGYVFIHNKFLGKLFKLKDVNYPLNIPRLYNELLQVHGKQLLIDGIFNGDPHPGNILVTPDGRLGLIDFGQIKAISRKDRRDIAEILLALSKGDSGKEILYKKALEVGFRTENNSPEILHKACVLAFDRDDLEMTEGMGLQNYVAEMAKKDQSKALPEEYIMAVRMCVILRGLSAILGPHHPPISLAQRWKGLANRCVNMYPPDLFLDPKKFFYPSLVEI